MSNRTVRNKRSWTPTEDEQLVNALMELHASGKYPYTDNGFKPRYFLAVQRLLDISLPNSGLKADPHIKSRLKTLKNNFIIVNDILADKDTNGFSWDPERCRLTASDQVWNDYIKANKNGPHLKDKTFPFYEKLSVIFGKERGMGSRAVDLGGEEDEADSQQSTPIENEELHIDHEIPLSERGMGSMSSSKRKRGNNAHLSHTNMESGTVFNVTFNVGKNLGTDFSVVSSEGTSSVELMRRVIKELDGLSGITLDQRIKAMDVIGHSPTRAEMFFMLDREGKNRMVQMVWSGSIS
ncbi:RNA-directed DNA polymerase, eukaryota [Tanacetum coccineum]|uniref:RNA-directed DNA polymerase, eukaryota n=1 Tax=Tanacetum coccineum TaxID=301880 RepID=A0ABQ5BBZ0_9ASTR